MLPTEAWEIIKRIIEKQDDDLTLEEQQAFEVLEGHLEY